MIRRCHFTGVAIYPSESTKLEDEKNIYYYAILFFWPRLLELPSSVINVNTLLTQSPSCPLAHKAIESIHKHVWITLRSPSCPVLFRRNSIGEHGIWHWRPDLLFKYFIGSQSSRTVGSSYLAGGSQVNFVVACYTSTGIMDDFLSLCPFSSSLPSASIYIVYWVWNHRHWCFSLCFSHDPSVQVKRSVNLWIAPRCGPLQRRVWEILL